MYLLKRGIHLAFTLIIRRKTMFHRKTVDVKQIIQNLQFKFGSDNDFYLLEEGKINQNTCILYNPKRIGRGIFFDFQKAEAGEVTISYNIPTTPSEMDDFICLASEIQHQMGKVTMYCEEETREYTYEELVDARERMIQYSIGSLNSFCSKDYSKYILTMAMWPISLPKWEVEAYKQATDLCQFEQYLHDKQNMDVYYAKPSIMRNKADGRILAFYTLTEGCESIFPVKADTFLPMKLEDIKIDDGRIRFYLFSENRARDEVCPYDKFIEYLREHGAMEYDEEHFIVPSMSKFQIDDMITSIGSVGSKKE